jgi:formate hydrogenlyase subunit 3/multisubunit Na+/H+ antiporter MnhD subunit
VLVATGLLALVPRGERWPTWIGASGAVLGSGVGLFGALHALLRRSPESLQLPWALPLASFSVAVDPLSAFFLLPTFGLAALAALYGAGYVRAPRGGIPAGVSWLWFNLLIASMALVLAARNAVLFLVAWELMSVASFFLVTLESDREDVRRAGRMYLIATHAGTACLIALFLLLAGPSGSLDFDQFPPRAAGAAAGSGALFLLAVIGFGVKAGFMPLHVWLPEAHPAAPAHVSAIMSGVMIKLGIYGLLRTLAFLGLPPPWCGWVLLCVGVVSGVLGVLLALAQHELKRLLAYHSVENIGIIACGLGLGLLGRSYHLDFLAVLGFGGALLHVLNHAMFKSLLFLGAGAVLRATHTGEIEHLGGLLRRMPRTGFAFWIGAAAISGLPPLNGFVSEFLIYLGSFRAAATQAPEAALAGVVVIGALALIGGLAAACFAKAFGIVFLGEPRSEAARGAREVGALLSCPMLLLAAGCLLLGLLSPWILPRLAPIIAGIASLPPETAAAECSAAAAVLLRWTTIAAAFLLLTLLIAAVRKAVLARRTVAAAGTWDCGYVKPTARMQYTASSFAQPITEVFGAVLGAKTAISAPLGLFPGLASLKTTTQDSFRERVFRPLLQEFDRRTSPLRRLQEGRVQIYVLYIALTLLALLVWESLGGR